MSENHLPDLSDVEVGSKSPRSHVMSELLFPLGILAAWYILNAWVLPRFGVQT